MDRRGSGFKKILGDYRKQPQYSEAMQPEFSSDYDAFFLVLKNLNYSKVLENKAKSAAKTTKKTVDKLLDIMEQNPNISVKEMAEKVGISVDGAQYHIRNLKKCGVIERVRPDKGGFWKTNQ